MELAQRIANDIFSQLKDYYDETEDDDQIYHYADDPNGATFSYLPFPGKAKPITEDDAKEIILKTVIQRLNVHGRVLLYTCRDNAEICIEHDTIPGAEDPEDIGIELQKGYDNKYYIAFD